LNVTQGWSVSLSADGETLAIGSPQYGEDDEGRVRLFRYNSGTSQWELYGSPIDGTVELANFVISPKLRFFFLRFTTFYTG
jgi:hypothetical protein